MVRESTNTMNRDHSGLEALYFGHTAALFHLVLNLTRNQVDVRDLLRELFILLSRNPNRLDEFRDPRAFLFRSIHNLTMDHCGAVLPGNGRTRRPPRRG